MGPEGGAGRARRHIAGSDEFLPNIKPRVIERWGLTYDKLSAMNPQIIAAYVPMQG